MDRGRYVVVHLCSSFTIDPQNFSRGANFLPTITILAIFETVKPHFKNYSGEIWREGAVLGLPPRAKF